MGRRYHLAKVKYGIIAVMMALVINVTHSHPVFADQTMSDVGITFTGHWEQPGEQIVPPTGNNQQSHKSHQSLGNGNHLTVVSEEKPRTTTDIAKLPQTGVQQDIQQIQLLGSSLLIVGISILFRKKDGFKHDNDK